MADEAMTFMVEDARLVVRNFTGVKGQYNTQGHRTFGVVVDDATAEVLLKDGWNVKYLKAREEGDEPTPFLPVRVNFENYPPRVTLITSTGRTRLNDGSIEMLDSVDIATVDLIVRASHYDVNGKQGIKAYLQSMFVTIEEDELERKYAVIDEEE